MNVYEKLQQLRVEVQNSGIKKSGSNKHLGYNYYELSDFVPTVNKLMNEHKLCSNISFGRLDDVATLEIINSQEPSERIVFICPMSTAELKNCHPVQNLGASTTYIRRYLWVTALELTDGDAIEPTTGEPQKPPQQTKPAEQPKTLESPQNAPKEQPVSTERIARLYAICKTPKPDYPEGFTQEMLKAHMMEKYGFDSTKKLTLTQYNETCKWAEGK